MGPDVGAVVVDVDGKVPHEFDSGEGAGILQIVHLKKEGILLKEAEPHGLIELRAGFEKGVLPAEFDLSGPFIPGKPAEMFLEGGKESVVVQPELLLFEKVKVPFIRFKPGEGQFD
ncbi:hypothetical protein MASR2M17_06790 [Aminivibrio sp.]